MKAPDFTLSAGPTMASARTLDALGSQIVYHLDPSFIETFARTTEKAAAFFNTKNDMLLLRAKAFLRSKARRGL